MKGHYKIIRPTIFKSGIDGPHLLITAGIHGDEYEPMMTVSRLVEEFSREGVLKKGSLTLLPIVNIPAYKAGSRIASDGMDLARTCPGNNNGSITEQIAFEVSKLIRSVDFLIDMHTGGRISEIFPLAGYMLSKDLQVRKRQREMAYAFNLPVIWGTSPHLEGRTLSVARDAGIPAIYTEYGGGGSCKEEIIQILKEGCLRVMKYLGMIPFQGSELSDHRYIIEDYRSESGLLQILYPAPKEGIFISHKEIGDKVDEGELIGTITDLISGEKTNICARESGILFIIRKLALVHKGDSTAGILPISQYGEIEIK